MNCKTTIDRYLHSNHINKVPLLVRLHTFFCPYCRKEIQAMQNKYKRLAQDQPFEMHRDISTSIMLEVLQSPIQYKKQVSYFKWISVGVVIVASRFLVSFSDTYIWLNQEFGGNYELPLNIVLGSVISVYSALFIGSHLKDMKRFSKYIQKKFG